MRQIKSYYAGTPDVGGRVLSVSTDFDRLTSVEAGAFLQRTTGLDATHVSAYTALINGLVADGIFSKLDMLHIYATQDSTTAKLNLVSTSYPGSQVGSPSFTVDGGYTGVLDNSGHYLDTGFNPASASSPKFIQNSAHISLWSVTNVGTVDTSAMGLTISGVEIGIYPKFTDNNAYFRVNGGGSGVANSSPVGFFVANRTNSTNIQGYLNTTAIFTDTSNNSSAPPNQNIITLARGQSGGGSYGSSHQLAMASIGSSLSGADVTNFYGRLRTYMTAVGVP